MTEYTAIAVGGPINGQAKTHSTKTVSYPERRSQLTLGMAEDEPVYYEHTYELDESQTPPVWAYRGEVFRGTMGQMEESAMRYVSGRGAG